MHTNHTNVYVCTLSKLMGINCNIPSFILIIFNVSLQAIPPHFLPNTVGQFIAEKISVNQKGGNIATNNDHGD